MRKLIAVRHAEVIDQAICYGRLDVPTQASAGTREQLRRDLHASIQTETFSLWSSPSQRCLEEAKRVSASLCAIPQVDPRLLELAFGAWEGQKWSDLESLPEFKGWMSEWQTSAPPHGERLSDLSERVCAWLAQLSHETSHIVFTHAGVIRQLHVSLEHLSWQQAMRIPIPHLTPIVWNFPFEP